MVSCFEGGWPIPLASVKSDLVEKYPASPGPVLCNGDRLEFRLWTTPMFTYDKVYQVRNELSPTLHLLLEENVCYACNKSGLRTWSSAHPHFSSPLLVPIPK